MSDYDPKSIPVLDDVIESDKNVADTGKAEATDSHVSTPENNLELFTAEPVETTEEDTEDEKPESALIDYSSNDESTELETVSDLTVTDISAQLNPMVNDIVSHIMPELERQLRIMVRKALEEKLPLASNQSGELAKSSTES